jgi:hypothetical protein
MKSDKRWLFLGYVIISVSFVLWAGGLVYYLFERIDHKTQVSMDCSQTKVIDGWLFHPADRVFNIRKMVFIGNLERYKDKWLLKVYTSDELKIMFYDVNKKACDQLTQRILQETAHGVKRIKA